MPGADNRYQVLAREAAARIEAVTTTYSIAKLSGSCDLRAELLISSPQA